MDAETTFDISRRQFLVTGGLTAAAACFAPGQLRAETEGIVVGAFKEAATAKVTVQNLRRNISVLKSSPLVRTSLKLSRVSMQIPSNS